MRHLIIILLTIVPYIVIGQIREGYNISTEPIQSNPAFTGAFSSGIFNINRRKTWFNTNNNFNTNYQTQLPKIKSGFGISYTRVSLYGDLKINSASLSYAHHLKLLNDKLSLSAGISATIDHYSNVNIDQWGKNYATHIVSYKYFNSGLLISNKKNFLSLGLNHLNNIWKKPHKPTMFKAIYGHKFTFGKEESLEIIPNLLYTLQGTWGKLTSRMNINYKKLMLLVGIRSIKTVEAGIGLNYSKFAIHYRVSNYYDQPIGNGVQAYKYYINHFNLQIKIPKNILRKTKAFDFNLF